MLKTDFTDSASWMELADKHLASYDLPRWHEVCSTEKMVQWLDRLDWTEKDFKKWTNTTLDDFMLLNPTWPLRAFVGLILEHYDEQSEGARIGTY